MFVKNKELTNEIGESLKYEILSLKSLILL
jgi:hypothetical protein